MNTLPPAHLFLPAFTVPAWSCSEEIHTFPPQKLTDRRRGNFLCAMPGSTVKEEKAGGGSYLRRGLQSQGVFKDPGVEVTSRDNF